MGGLIHEFILIPESTINKITYHNIYDKLKIARISDDLISYIYDSLLWIKTYNPSKNMVSQFNLNRHGNTIIKRDGADIMKNIFNAWADLFSNSPDKIILTGNIILDNANVYKGREKIVIIKNEVINNCKLIANMAEEIINSEEKLVIYHFGV